MPFTYEGPKTKEISFPLGGIGTGSVGLAGNGRFVDWEIFNHPDKTRTNHFTHIAVKAEALGHVLDARALQGDISPPFSESMGNYQSGPSRDTLAGMPHFRTTTFEATFPFAVVRFGEERFPGKVSLRAFNPFIPLNDFDSSLPVAMYEIEFENDHDFPILYSACFTLANPLPRGRTVNEYSLHDGLHALHLSASGQKEDDSDFGDLTLATDAQDVSYQEYWYRGAWFDSLGIFWRDFNVSGPLAQRTYDRNGKNLTENPYGNPDLGSLCAHVEIAPGQRGHLRFVLSWSFPNYTNTWNPEKKSDCSCKGDCTGSPPNHWKNYYATRFDDSSSSMEYAFRHWNRLESQSRLFAEVLDESSIPRDALDAITGNLAILKSPTCLRLTDGSFYGFEGCLGNVGCCEGSCTHVWNYAYALPYLFPALERSMRDLDYRYNASDTGAMAFRLQLPIGRAKSTFRPCADGQFGGVVKAYRDWKISGDQAWLRKNWNAIRRSIEYAWHPKNPDLWDPDRTGVLTGRQHHTLDMELFGASSWLTGFYLAALKAGAEMAEAMEEPECAAEFRSIHARGKAWVDRELFNGEYYIQKVEIRDRDVLLPFRADTTLYDSYWNEEAGELKYQIGTGCAIDQVIAQWHSNISGLGEIFDPSQTRQALASIYKYNFKKDLRDFFNPCRLFALQDESGVVICEWPDSEKKPKVPLTYAEECMNGFEYQVAIHMIQSGMEEQGLEIVRAIRRRYDGERRNPWNEFECGNNYARSMASYALLLAYSGFTCDMTKGIVRFAPLHREFKGLWSLDSGWGNYEQNDMGARMTVLQGSLRLNELDLPIFKGKNPIVRLDNQRVESSTAGEMIMFGKTLSISAGQSIEILGQCIEGQDRM